MHPPFETVIPCAPIDLNKLPYVVGALIQYTDTSGVHVITPAPFEVPRLPSTKDCPVTIHADKDVLDFDHTRFKYRPNWIYQQFLKLFQNVTETDWYLVIDADLIFADYVNVFAGEQPIFLLGNDQLHEPYFCFTQRLFGFGKTFYYSFLSECTLYNKHLISDMLAYGGYLGKYEFLERAVEIIDGGCYPAESELYGSFVNLAYPGLYTFHHLRTALGGKYGNRPYTEKEIEDRIREVNSLGGADILTIHSWEGAVE